MSHNNTPGFRSRTARTPKENNVTTAASTVYKHAKLKPEVAAKVFPASRPAGASSEIETIGPEKAAQYLERGVGYNRRIRPVVVKSYAETMRRGNWLLTNDDICFDAQGWMINGHHRMHAVIESGTTQKFGVKRGLDADAFRYMDVGAKRGLSDVLEIIGTEYPSLVAALARRSAVYAKAGYLSATISLGNNSSPGNPLHADRDDHFEVAIGYAPIRDAIRFTGPKTSAFKKIGMTPTQIGFGHLLVSPWHDGYEAFVQRMLTRDFTGRNDPANALFDRMLSSMTAPVNSPNRLSPAAVFGYLVIACNADFKGRGVTKLQWPKGDNYPQPLVQVAERITSSLGWPEPKGLDEDDG